MVDLSLRTAVIVIVSAIVLLLMFPFTTRSFAEAPHAFSEAECRASVVLRAKTDIDILDVESPFPFECSSKTVFLEYDSSSRKKDTSLKSMTPYYYIGARDETKVKKIFAEYISLCLWQMAEAEDLPFSGDSLTRCIICDDIIIDPEIIDPKKGNITALNHFDNYLSSNKFSKTKDYYSSYLNQVGLPERIPLADASGNPISYTVYFGISRDSRLATAAKAAAATGTTLGTAGLLLGPKGAIIGGGVGALGGGIYGFFKGRDTVWLIDIKPIDKVDTKCQSLF